MPRHDRVTNLLMMRDNGAALPEDVDLCLAEVERLGDIFKSIGDARQSGRMGNFEPIDAFILRLKKIAETALEP